jgi:hypothetical protein
MLRHGRGSGDRYGVWMRGVGLSAMRSGRHIAQRDPTHAWLLADAAALLGSWARPETVLCGVRQRLALSTVADEEPTSGLGKDRCLGSWRTS